MKLKQDDLFRKQQKEFLLHYRCEDCAFFDEPGERCSHRYPTLEHRRALEEDPSSALVFCKEFSTY